MNITEGVSTDTQFSATQGSEFTYTITYWAPDPSGTLIPGLETYGPLTGVDCTGWGARMQVRPDYADRTDTIILNLTLGDGLVWTDAATGVLQLTIPAPVTQAVPIGLYRFDLEVVPNGDESQVVKLLAGRFVMKGEVTR